MIDIKSIAAEYGFKTASINFEAHDDFKVSWERSIDWIKIHMSDYIEDAPETVLKDIVTKIFRMIRGASEEDAKYSEETKNYFVHMVEDREKVEKFVSRHDAEIIAITDDGLTVARTKNKKYNKTISGVFAVAITQYKTVCPSMMETVHAAVDARNKFVKEVCA